MRVNKQNHFHPTKEIIKAKELYDDNLERLFRFNILKSNCQVNSCIGNNDLFKYGQRNMIKMKQTKNSKAESIKSGFTTKINTFR